GRARADAAAAVRARPSPKKGPSAGPRRGGAHARTTTFPPATRRAARAHASGARRVRHRSRLRRRAPRPCVQSSLRASLASAAGRNGAVADVGDLKRLALVARRQPVDAEARPVGDGVAAGPELERLAAEGAVLEHPAELAVPDLPADLGAEAERAARLVDRER